MWTIVGERYNAPSVRGLDRLGDRAWAETSLCVIGPPEYEAFSDAGSRRKLARLGLERDDVLALNLLPPAPQGVPWDADRAARIADLIRPVLPDDGSVLLAGARVATAFGVCRAGNPLAELYGEPVDAGGLRAVLLPHPSGLCRWWNDPRRVRKLRAKLDRLRAARS